jgi:6-phosphogluconolactonase
VNVTPGPSPPATELRIEADVESAWRTAADAIADAVAAGVSVAGTAAIAVSGGGTPRGLHRLLAEPPWVDAIPWGRLHVFWADERLVPYDDPASNYGAARLDWLDRLARAPAGVHPVPVGLPPETAADRYAHELRSHFRGRGATEPILDLAVLGIGSDGHTASLFPGHPALDEAGRWTAAVQGGDPDVWRVTLTYPVLNRARRVLFLAVGDAKAEVVRRVLCGATPGVPAQRVRPAAGSVTWVLDRAAARLLEDKTACG